MLWQLQHQQSLEMGPSCNYNKSSYSNKNKSWRGFPYKAKLSNVTGVRHRKQVVNGSHPSFFFISLLIWTQSSPFSSGSLTYVGYKDFSSLLSYSSDYPFPPWVVYLPTLQFPLYISIANVKGFWLLGSSLSTWCLVYPWENACYVRMSFLDQELCSGKRVFSRMLTKTLSFFHVVHVLVVNH